MSFSLKKEHFKLWQKAGDGWTLFFMKKQNNNKKQDRMEWKEHKFLSLQMILMVQRIKRHCVCRVFGSIWPMVEAHDGLYYRDEDGEDDDGEGGRGN